MLRRALLPLAVLVTLGVAACGGDTPGASNTPAASSVGSAGVNLGSATIKITATDQLAFEPAMQSAHVGDIIEWTNTGSVMHTITFDSESALSDPTFNPGGTWEVKFTTAGTYQYHCSIHPNMVGTIVVS